MENYPGNSKIAKEVPKEEVKEPKKIEKVITGEVVRRKKPLGRRFLDTFIGSGDAGSVWGYVLNDVLVPAAKDMVSDAVSSGIERMLFGDVRGRARGSRPGSRLGSQMQQGHVQYNRMSPTVIQHAQQSLRPDLSRRARATHDFDEIVLQTKVEADEAIRGMLELLDQYGVVSVTDLYELVGITSNFTDEKFGWTDLRSAGSTRIKGGYLLDLPRPVELN